MTSERGTLTGSDLARMRQGCYRVLASGYGAPTLERVAQIDSGLAALEELGLGGFAFGNAIRHWLDGLIAADLDSVAAEQVRLFGAGMDGAVCAPIESQHLGKNLQGDPARHAGRIEDLMRRSGFEPRDGDRPPDHLIVELELASALCGAEAAGRAEGDTGRRWLEWQQELVGVLAMWVPGFAGTVAERDRSGVFGSLTAATAAFVLHEHDLVRVLLQASEVDSP